MILQSNSRRCAASLLGLIGALALPMASAQAAEPKWSGFSIYGGIGLGQVDGDVSLADSTTYSMATECDVVPQQGWQGVTVCIPLGPLSATPSNASNSALRSDAGILGTLGLGADLEYSGIVIGAFVDGEISRSESKFSMVSAADLGPIGLLQGTTIVNGKMEEDFSFSIGGRVGILSNDRRALIYGLAAYTQVHFDNPVATIENAATGLGGGFVAAPIAVSLPDRYNGLTVGAGAEVLLSGSWSVKFEGRYTNLRAQSVSYSSTTDVRTSLGYTEFGPGCNGGSDCEAFVRTTGTSNGKIDIDPDVWSLRFALSYKLN